MEQRIAGSVAPRRLNMLLLGGFAAVALLLAALGLYGVMSYAATQQTREIGIRMALGAQRRTVMWQVLRRGARLVFTGLDLGAVIAAVVTRGLSGMRFGVSVIDVQAFVIMSLLLLTVGGLATYVPARRAMRVDAMEALRYE